MKTHVAALAVLTLLAAGCSLAAPQTVGPTGQQTAPPGTTTASASAEPTGFTPLPMPVADGGDMLWPTTLAANLSDGAYWGRYGFIDKNARIIRPEQYLDFSYCTDASSRPTRLAAINQDESVDVFTLDGTLALTISASKHEYPHISCRGNEIWTFISDEAGLITDGVAYDADTGKRIRTLDGTKLVACDDTPEAISADLPPGYLTWVSDEWAIDTEPDASTDPTKAMNITTSAVVSLNEGNGTSASGPYLIVSHNNNLMEIYDRHGKLTPFGKVTPVHDVLFWHGYTNDCNDESFQAPYYWVTSGRVQGYVDDSAV